MNTTGNYKVGTSIFSFEDKSRKETLGGDSGMRKISVRMYYLFLSSKIVTVSPKIITVT